MSKQLYYIVEDLLDLWDGEGFIGDPKDVMEELRGLVEEQAAIKMAENLRDDYINALQQGHLLEEDLQEGLSDEDN